MASPAGGRDMRRVKDADEKFEWDMTVALLLACALALVMLLAATIWYP